MITKFKIFENIINATADGLEPKTYWCVSINKLKDSLNKIEDICGTPVSSCYYSKDFKKYHVHPYCYIGYNESFLSLWEWDTLILDHDLLDYYFGDQVFKDDNYKFGGYINCSKEEVQDYIDNYEFIKKYNL